MTIDEDALLGRADAAKALTEAGFPVSPRDVSDKGDARRRPSI